MTALDALLLTGGGIVAGVANTLAGGGSTVTLPLLLSCGLSAPVANGTNHLGHFIGAAARVSAFARSDALHWRSALWLTIPSVVGAGLGAWLATLLPPQGLESIIIVAALVAAVLMVANPKRFLEEKEGQAPRLGPWQMLLIFVVGAWSGFIVLESGTFLLLALTLGVGYGLVPAVAAKAVISFASMILSTMVFACSGEIDGLAALYLSIGTVIGAWLAARLALHGRAKLWLYWSVVVFVWAEVIHLIIRVMASHA
jgi:uncharacterized membrane protein YfcA